MKGYKAFNNNLICRDYQFTTDKTHRFDGKPYVCKDFTSVQIYKTL